eukprot:7194586-Pyramimonas_sp.AAC.1
MLIHTIPAKLASRPSLPDPRQTILGARPRSSITMSVQESFAKNPAMRARARRLARKPNLSIASGGLFQVWKSNAPNTDAKHMVLQHDCVRKMCAHAILQHP